MAFSADELRVLRRALATALQSALAPSPPSLPSPLPARRRRAEEAQEYRWLAEALDEARREAERLRAFLAADLARYRAALPGAESGYLTRLEEALAAGCRPSREDVAALRGLCARPVPGAEARRRAGLLRRCERSAGAPEARDGSRSPVPAPADVLPSRRPAPPPRRALPA
ncbi:hypothetical protein GCM10010420_48880 [Streptomyces glaucosporus]|uniref:Uncharacterized protein n=1 Tax=Streptomyces glaucosporus TaxID=284044 RepID=A0ABN3ITJ4_9ACTN